MKVRAIELGYYDNKRMRPGKVFHIKSEKEFSKKWMEKVSGGKRSKKPEVIEDVEPEGVEPGGDDESSESISNQEVI